VLLNKEADRALLHLPPEVQVSRPSTLVDPFKKIFYYNFENTFFRERKIRLKVVLSYSNFKWWTQNGSIYFFIQWHL